MKKITSKDTDDSNSNQLFKFTIIKLISKH